MGMKSLRMASKSNGHESAPEKRAGTKTSMEACQKFDRSSKRARKMNEIKMGMKSLRMASKSNEHENAPEKRAGTKTSMEACQRFDRA